MALAVVGTLLMYDVVDLQAGCSSASSIGSAHRRPDGHLDADDRRAAADGAVARLRRPGRGAGRHGPLLRGAVRIDQFTMAILAIEVLLGALTFTGSLVAFGKLQELIPSSIKGAAESEPDQLRAAWRRAADVRVAGVLSRTHCVRVPAADPREPGVRLLPGDADRRGRHADGHFAAQLLRRPVGEPDGLRARQLPADHRRGARRQLGPDPVDHHVQGDEPLVHQRAVRPDGADAPPPRATTCTPAR